MNTEIITGHGGLSQLRAHHSDGVNIYINEHHMSNLELTLVSPDGVNENILINCYCF